MTFGLVLNLCGLLTIRSTGLWGQSPLFQSLGFLGAILGIGFILKSNVKLTLPIILVISLFSRILFIGYEMSDDIARYLWEGYIQVKGFNPYQMPPMAQELVSLRDINWQLINHKSFTAIYPPLAQLIFNGVGYFYPSQEAWRFILILFDLVSVFYLFKILSHYDWPKNNIFLFALNPFVLLYGMGEGHIDSVMLTFVLAATYCFIKNQYSKFWTLFILAGCVKYFCWFMLPIFINKKSIKKSYWGIVGLTPFLLYPIDGIFESLIKFNNDFQFNSPLFYLSDYLGFDKIWIGVLFFVLYLLYLLVQPHPIKNFAALSLMFISFLPTIHPWYFLLPAGFLVLVPRLSFISLQITTALFLLPFYHDYLITKNWDFNASVMILIWGTPLIIWFIERFVPQFRWPFENGVQSHNSVKNLSILVPTYNESASIEVFYKRLIEAIGMHHCEVIFVDGQSKDNTIELLEEYSKNKPKHVSIKILISPKGGRGYQLNYALGKSVGDWVAICHVDTVIAEGIFDSLKNELNSNLAVSGGACTMEFITGHTDSSVQTSLKKNPLSFVKTLNSFRNRVLGISFGDQLQFFRKSEVLNKNCIPQIPLMEDVELALKMKEAGRTVHLPFVVKVSDRRWQSMNRFKNAFLIIKLTLAYLVFRRLQWFPKTEQWFVKQYYKS